MNQKLKRQQKNQRWVWVFALLLLFLLYSGLQPYDRLTWILEVSPVLVGLPFIWWSLRRARLSHLMYGVVVVHAVILIVGGVYTYARVPLGFWLQDWFGLNRNPYDKIGHFFQGLTPVLLACELSVRYRWVSKRGLVLFFAVCVAMAISAVYELIEWWSALILGQGADEFLGMQGDIWDTQSDMFFALLGAIAGVVIFSWWDKGKYRFDKSRIT